MMRNLKLDCYPDMLTEPHTFHSKPLATMALGQDSPEQGGRVSQILVGIERELGTVAS